MIKEQKQIYVAPTVVTVEFRVEVGMTTSLQTSGFSEIALGSTTTSQSPNNASGGSATENFFEYDW